MNRFSFGEHEAARWFAGFALALATLVSPEVRGASPAETAEPAAKVTPAELSAIADAAVASIVHVEYTLQYDKGEAPYGSGWATRCPNCGNYHGEDTDKYIQEQRPAEIAGFLVSPTQVITSDFLMHPRFLKKLEVRHGEKSVQATIAGYYAAQNAVLLELAEPLSGTPLAFADTAPEGPYFAITHVLENGEWQTSVSPLGGSVTMTDGGQRFVAAPSRSLIVDKSGVPVALSMSEQLPPDDTWKVSPLTWESISQADMDARVAKLDERIRQTLLRVQLSFRSPKAPADPYGGRSYGHDSDEESTERNVIGVLIEPQKLLVLAELKPSATARLERVLVHLPAGADGEVLEPVDATFAASLRDYGCFVATLNSPLGGNDVRLPLGNADITGFRNRLLLCADAKVAGDEIVCHTSHRRITSFEMGWRRQIYPEIAGGNSSNYFLLDAELNLVALPVTRRTEASLERQWRSTDATLTSTRYLADVVAKLPDGADPDNVPLSEDEENRLAWLGVDLQAMTPELARANGVSHLTSDGEHGALVTHVYAGSPAAEAGIETGQVLLRLHTSDQPKPINVKLEGYSFSDQPFPWDQFDQLPEEYFDQIPRPWPSAESSLSRLLTDLGMGTPVTVEFFADGKPFTKEFQIVQSPAHFDSAKRFKSEPMGLTVRDMTYEVRRYFQRKDEDPGVIISKIETGSKASKAGLKPYEYVTHVNESPVGSVKEFQTLTDGQTEVRLSVRRMTRGRVVKITLDADPPTTQAVE